MAEPAGRQGNPVPDEPESPEGREKIMTGDVAGDAPGTNVTGGDTPGGGGTAPLQFDDEGRPLPPGRQGRHGGQA